MNVNSPTKFSKMKKWISTEDPYLCTLTHSTSASPMFRAVRNICICTGLTFAGYSSSCWDRLTWTALTFLPKVHSITFTDSTHECAIARALWSIFFVLLEEKWAQEGKHVITVHLAHRKLSICWKCSII